MLKRACLIGLGIGVVCVVGICIGIIKELEKEDDKSEYDKTFWDNIVINPTY